MTLAPVSGVTIRDDARDVAGRYCARLLAQFGAEVRRDPGLSGNSPTRGSEAADLFGSWLDQGKRDGAAIGDFPALAIHDGTGDRSAADFSLEPAGSAVTGPTRRGSEMTRLSKRSPALPTASARRRGRPCSRRATVHR